MDIKMTGSFIHTGVTHDLSETEVSMHQVEYVAALRPVQSAELTSLKDDDLLTGTLFSFFLTLLGAAAWALLTRMDVAVYVASLQRHSHGPTALHLRRLNRVISYMQRHPTKLVYRRLPLPVNLIAIGDSAYQAPANAEAAVDPLVMRG